MIRKLKPAIGLAALIALIASAFGSPSASGTVNGHFVSDAPSGKTEAILTAATGGGSTHFLTMHADGTAATCHSITYTGSMSGSTTQSIRAQANFFGCTIGEGPGSVTTNGCDTEFWSRTSGDGTVKLLCPAGKKVEVHAPNCTESFPEQLPAGGVGFKTIEANGKHAITAELTVTGLEFERHGGLCVFLGTKGTGATLTGAVIAHGIDAQTQQPVNITAT
ncbi:MAG TPA: hypothetical protein VF729_07080 [Solirubrobacterales bacterium]